MVVHFYEELFRHGNLAVIDKFVGPVYIDHNPESPDGSEAIGNVVTGLRAAYPDMNVSIERVIAEDDLVLLHINAVLEPGGEGMAIGAIFRVETGKIVEHWEVMQQVPDRTVSGNDLFSTLSTPRGQSPDPRVSTAQSKRVASDLVNELFTGRDVTAFDRYASDPYFQHNPQSPNGIAAAKEFFASSFSTNPDLSVSVKRVIAEGDYVAFHSHSKYAPEDLGFAVLDIYRVRDGKVVEHWDVIQQVPATSANDNTMF
ncbi:hypothetical protein GRC12_04460 [Streptomyces griseorubiginosus]|nr:hypothetical protein [Streptomyces griseorubiginosus]